MRHILLIINLLFSFFILKAQKIINDLSTNLDQGSIYSLEDNEPLNSLTNIAVNARIKKVSFAISCQNKYLINDLNQTSAIVVLPTNVGGFSLAAANLGFSNYRQSKLSVGYGRMVGKSAELGIAFIKESLVIPGYLKTAAFTNEIGLLIHITDKTCFGFGIFNPLGVKFSSYDETNLAIKYTAGFGYTLSRTLLLHCEIQKEGGNKVQLLTGFNFIYSNRFYFSTSFCFPETKQLFSAGLGLNSLLLKFSLEHHSLLGFSPGVSCSFRINKN